MQAAMMAFPAGTRAPDLAGLRGRVDAAWSAWQGSRHRFSTVGEVLPDLVTDVRAAQRGLAAAASPEERRKADRIAADLCFLVRTFTRRSGRADLALLAADRGVAAAESADDPVRIAAAKWNMCHALLALGKPDAAEEVALAALSDLAREHPSDGGDEAALAGALWLAASAAAARRGADWAARGWLREKAEPVAVRCGETNIMWTVFGPTNVLLHAMNVETEAGQASEALRIADTINTSALPSLERQTTFALDVARCYELRRDDPGVLLHLTSAEATGPEDLRHNATARGLVSGLLKRARPTYAPQVRALARRIELVS